MVLPISLTIGSFAISLVLIGVLLFVAIFLFCYWFQSKEKSSTLGFFDAAFLVLISGFIFSRIIGILDSLQVYLAELPLLFAFGDKQFAYTGVFLGLIMGVIIIFNLTAKEKDFHVFIEKVVISYVFAIIPLIILSFLDGEMLGVKIQNGFSIAYSDGTMRMPINIFRVAYNLLFILVWALMGRKATQKGLFGYMYLILFGAVEFALRFFSEGFSPLIFNNFDFQQFASLISAITGIILLMNYYNIRIFKLAPKKEEEQLLIRKKFDFDYNRNASRTTKDRFTMSYSSVKESTETGEMSPQEKMRMLANTFKRRTRR